MKRLAEKGKPAPRPTEMDLYAIIVQYGFKNTPDHRTAGHRLALHCQQHEGPELARFAFQNRHRLAALVDDVWAWESMEATIAASSLTRVQRLRQAAGEPCVCGGVWRQVAMQSLIQNGIDPADFAEHVYLLLRDGRREDRKAVVLVGRFGGEGKSFL